jgi:hypothetical protein
VADDFGADVARQNEAVGALVVEVQECLVVVVDDFGECDRDGLVNSGVVGGRRVGDGAEVVGQRGGGDGCSPMVLSGPSR